MAKLFEVRVQFVCGLSGIRVGMRAAQGHRLKATADQKLRRDQNRFLRARLEQTNGFEGCDSRWILEGT